MNSQQMREELKNINNNATITITSYDSSVNFKLEQVKDTEYILYISRKVTNVNFLFYNNRKIRRIIFDNWDTSNINNMKRTFASLDLLFIDDFSKLDFISLENADFLFEFTTIKGNFFFVNHTLNNLKIENSMFSRFKCDNLTVDIGKTKLESMWGMFDGSNIGNKIKCLIKETSDNLDISEFLWECNCPIIDLSEINVSKATDIKNCLKDTKSKKIIMPNTTPLNENLEIGEISKDIEKIYCSKEWSKILKEV